MKPIEDMLADKIYELVNYVLSKKFIPDIKLETVDKLTRDDVRSLKKQLGIEGVILDIDETVRTGMNKIPKCNEQWLDMLKEELKVIVVSNGILDSVVISILVDKSAVLCSGSTILDESFTIININVS